MIVPGRLLTDEGRTGHVMLKRTLAVRPKLDGAPVNLDKACAIRMPGLFVIMPARSIYAKTISGGDIALDAYGVKARA